MHSVLLVDDEPWVLEDLRTIVDYNSFGFNIIGKANDGISALEMIKQQRPDLIIADIKMPNMTGLELLKAVNIKHKDILTVFISAYGEFTLARQAVGLGAFDYLLKPVEKSDLEELLLRVKPALVQKRVERENAIKIALIEYINKIIEGTEITEITSFMPRLIQSGIEVNDRVFFVGILKRGSNFFDLKEFFPNFWVCSFPIGQRRDIIIFSKKTTEPIGMLGVKKLWAWLLKNKAVLGVGRIMNNLNELERAFVEANIMLEQKFLTGREEGLYFYRKTNGLTNLGLNSKDKMPEVSDVIEKLYVRLKNKKINIEGALHVYNQVISITQPKSDLVINDSKSLVDTYRDVGEMLNFLKNSIFEQDAEAVRYNEKIAQLIEYVNANYDKKLLINDLAKMFYFNSSYLSVLFKKYTGKSFTNYLMELRFKKAKELLQRTDLSLYKIAEMVGYENYFHFSKLFKKYEGQNPTSYKKNS